MLNRFVFVYFDDFLPDHPILSLPASDRFLRWFPWNSYPLTSVAGKPPLLVLTQFGFCVALLATVQFNENAVQLELFWSTEGIEFLKMFVDKMEVKREKKRQAFASNNLN